MEVVLEVEDVDEVLVVEDVDDVDVVDEVLVVEDVDVVVLVEVLDVDDVLVVEVVVEVLVVELVDEVDVDEVVVLGFPSGMLVLHTETRSMVALRANTASATLQEYAFGNARGLDHCQQYNAWQFPTWARPGPRRQCE